MAAPPRWSSCRCQPRDLTGGERGNASAGKRGSAAALPRTPVKGGAGLELDLTDPRHRDRLPSELRPGLPDRGFVNYLEAQAVVRSLEALASERVFSEGAAIGVMALYPAQAELIRRLVALSPTLTAAKLNLKVDVPGSCRERECLVVLLSLTRSHTHRAVTFGEEPQLLALALTRARGKVLLFGDPGTLARRSQWEGPLDHLDELAAARERALIAQLVRYLQGQGAHARAFHVREGACK